MDGISKYGVLVTICETSADSVSGYYSTLFTHLQQKDISGFLVYMWQSDPFKAKWAILAKAYSVIRDQEGKENAPLDKFLFINSNLIGIVAPKSYMVILGWVIAPVDGQLMLRRDLKFNPNSIDTRLLTTNLSVDDVVKHNYNNGYIMGAPSAAAAFGNGPSLTMATSAQPPSQNEATNGHAGETPDLEEGSGSVHHAEGSQAQLNLAENLTTTLTLSPRFDPDNHSPMALQYINSRVPDPSVDPPISSLVNTAYHLSGDYPFTPDFDPDLPGQIFDPFLGNQFNAFNMSDWVDEEAF